MYQDNDGINNVFYDGNLKEKKNKMKMKMVFLPNRLMFRKMSCPKGQRMSLKAKILRFLKSTRDHQLEFIRIIPLKVS